MIDDRIQILSAAMAMTNANEEKLLDCVENDTNFDCNNNDMIPESGTKRPSKEGDVNERSRKLIKSCFVTLTSNLNVLVIGSKGSGNIFELQNLFSFIICIAM